MEYRNLSTISTNKYIINHKTHSSNRLNCLSDILASVIYFKNRLSSFKYYKIFRVHEKTLVREGGKEKKFLKEKPLFNPGWGFFYHLGYKWTVFLVIFHFNTGSSLAKFVTCLGWKNCGRKINGTVSTMFPQISSFSLKSILIYLFYSLFEILVSFMQRQLTLEPSCNWKSEYNFGLSWNLTIVLWCLQVSHFRTPADTKIPGYSNLLRNMEQ